MHLQPVGSRKWQIKAAMVLSVHCNKVFTRKNVVKTVPPEVLKEQVFEWGATHSGCLAHACHEHSSVPRGLHLPAPLAKHSPTNPHHSYDDSEYSCTITFSTASPRNQCNSLLWIGSCTRDPLEVSTQRNGLNWLRRKMSAVTLKEYACGGTLWKVWKHR